MKRRLTLKLSRGEAVGCSDSLGSCFADLRTWLSLLPLSVEVALERCSHLRFGPAIRRPGILQSNVS